MRRAFLGPLLASLAAVVPLAAAEPDLPARIAAARARVVAVDAAFEQEAVAGQPDDAPQRIVGTLLADASGPRLRYRLTQRDPADPVAETAYLSDGEQRWEITRSMADVPPDVIRRPADADDAELRRLAALLRGDLAVLAEAYAIAAEGDRLTLTARDAAVEPARIIAEFDRGLRPTAVTTEDRQQRRSRYRVTALTDNPAIDERRFRP